MIGRDEIVDLGRQVGSELRWVEAGHGTNGRPLGKKSLPESITAKTDRSYRTDAGDNHAAFHRAL
jgi:hypothetical protein